MNVYSMGKIPPFLNGWAYKYSRLFFFITNQKNSIKTEGGLTSRCLWCNPILHPWIRDSCTEGTYTVVLYIYKYFVDSCVMCDGSSIMRIRTEERDEKRGKAGRCSACVNGKGSCTFSPLPLQQFRGKARWDTAVAAMRNLPSSAKY
jgi:hypothetical protein